MCIRDSAYTDFVVDYVLGLVTMSQTNPLKLDRLQHEAVGALPGTTKDTPIEMMRLILVVPLLQNTDRKLKRSKHALVQ